MKIFLLALVFTALTMPVTQAAEAPRSFSFVVSSACDCASCNFDAGRVLSKFEGVKKVKLDEKERVLKIDFIEARQPLSALALAVARLDIGKGSTLMWPLPTGIEAAKAGDILSHLAGVASAKTNAKMQVAYLTFNGKTAVTISQLDDAFKAPLSNDNS